MVEVRAPSTDELKKMVPKLYKHVLDDLEVKEHFTSKLDKDVIRVLSSGKGASIRQIKSAMEDGIANAVARSNQGELLRIKVEDVSSISQQSKPMTNPIGFIWEHDIEL